MLAIPGLFITGTDTGVGKTYVAAMIAERLLQEGVNVGAYKPACSGAIVSDAARPVWDDVEVLHRATGERFDRQRISPQRFIAPLAPPVAAGLENRIVDAGLLRTGGYWWEDHCEFLLVEGVGGWLCPLTDSETVADLAVDFRLPLLIVARASLGTINHTLLTVEAVRQRGVPIAGIVLSETTAPVDPSSVKANVVEIEKRCDVRVLGVVPYRTSICLPDPGAQQTIDVWSMIRSVRGLGDGFPATSRSLLRLPFPSDEKQG
ncbi:MAG: dethiobiotin synthase [Planctomycetota bacterium]|nr:dethiobiotin synthase [Planctomycetaceae bacterium]MDQ3332097.1 dethiobiotin synthase [Planctomycetota bacterium]